QHRQRRVVAHGTAGLFAVLGHGPQHDDELLGRVAKGQLVLGELGLAAPVGYLPCRRSRVVAWTFPVGVCVDRGRRAVSGWRRYSRERYHVPAKPLTIGLAGCDLRLDVLVLVDALGLKVNSDHLPRPEPPPFDDPLGLNRSDAHFRPGDDETVLRDDVAQGTQAVAVEPCP